MTIQVIFQLDDDNETHVTNSMLETVPRVGEKYGLFRREVIKRVKL